MPEVSLSLCISLLLAIYAPLELFFTNLDDFPFSFGALFQELVKLFFLLLVLCLLCFFLCCILHKRLYYGALLAGLTGLLCTYVQGVYMSGTLPSPDAEAVDWSQFTGEYIASGVLWVVVIALVVVLTCFLRMERMKTVIIGVSAFLSAVMLVTVVTVGIQYDGFAARRSTIVSTDHEFDMSQEENLVIFVVDAVDSATFQTMLDTTNPEFRDIFEDFTYYPDTVCAYPYTHHSVPFLLTGQWYEWDEPFQSYAVRAYGEAPLLTTLQDRGYRMGVYDEELLCDETQPVDFENVVEGEPQFESFWALAKEEVKLVWYKYAPYPLKRYAPIYMDLYRSMLQMEGGAQSFWESNLESYPDIQNAQIRISDTPCFRFIHVEGAHWPFRYNGDVETIDEEDGSYELNMEAAMTIVKTYLQKLKDAGVYDNTAIVVMADHGFNNPSRVSIDGISRSNAFLAVKGMGEKHPMEISQAPISYEDLQTAYLRLLDGAHSHQVFDARPGDQRARRFMLYWYDNESSAWEYVQNGHAANLDTMVPTGVERTWTERD